MSVFDIVLIILILCGAFYMVYRSVFRKKNHCGDCSSQNCEKRDENKICAETNGEKSKSLFLD